MSTVRNEPCPTCKGKEDTEFVALIPHVGLLPHQYAVGPNCYRSQWALAYGEDEPCPVDAVPEKAPTKKPSAS